MQEQVATGLRKESPSVVSNVASEPAHSHRTGRQGRGEFDFRAPTAPRITVSIMQEGVAPEPDLPIDARRNST